MIEVAVARLYEIYTGCSNSLIPTRSSPACCEAKSLEGRRGRRRKEDDLSTVNGDVVGVKTETALLVYEEIHDLLALVTLKLDHLAGLFIIDLVAIASELLSEKGKNLAGVKLSRKTSDRGQRLATIALLNTNMDVILDLFVITGVVVGFGEGVEGLEIFDGHKLGCSGVSRGKKKSLGGEEEDGPAAAKKRRSLRCFACWERFGGVLGPFGLI